MICCHLNYQCSKPCDLKKFHIINATCECYSLYSFTCHTLKLHNKHELIDHEHGWSYLHLISINMWYEGAIMWCIFGKGCQKEFTFKEKGFSEISQDTNLSKITHHVLVISCYKDDIVITTQDQGRAEVKRSNNIIIQIMKYNWLLSHIR